MGELEDGWTVLVGQQPTDYDKQNLYRIRDATKLKTTDAVWQLLIAFQYYQKLYEQFPGRIAAAAAKVTEDVRAAAQAEAKAAHAEAKKVLTEAVRQAAVKAARDAAGAAVAKWVSIATVLICAAIVLVNWRAFGRGEATGRAVGENVAKKECAVLVAASSWGNTPEGQLAYALAKAGGLGDVGRCSGRGMVPRDGWCTVAPERGKVLARWPIPASSKSNSGGDRE
jgi:23S rRNA maturation mini-RNase III